ncbi:MAG: inorganic phosphate transporter [Nitrososphaerales archaeon]|jgi:phosphate/sulfate permease
MDSLLLGLAATLAFLFGWNNSSFLIGNIRGSGTLSYRVAVVVSIIGLCLGVLLEGSKMATSLAGSLAPSTTGTVLLVTLLVSVTFTLALTLLSLPVSFSVVMVGAFLGATLSSHIQVDLIRSEEVIAFWFLAPVATAVLTFAIYSSVTRLVTRFSILTVDSLNRTGTVVSALLVSYTLGGNNIGMIFGSAQTEVLKGTSEVGILFLLAIVAAIGLVALGRGGVSGTIGDKMLSLSPQGVFSAFLASSAVVWIGTQRALPISISQCLLGGMLGAAYTRSMTVLNRRLVLETVSLWVVVPLLSFGLGYLLLR